MLLSSGAPASRKNVVKALLVSMHDGWLGADHVAVVDPLRGEVFRRPQTQVVRLEGNNVVIELYRPEDAGKPDARVYKTEPVEIANVSGV